MVLLEFAMNPPDRGDGLSAYVARILEGNFDEMMQVVGDCFHALEPDCERIGMNLKMDYRAGTASRLQSKVDAVQRHLGRTLQT
jgi:uncharacterized protein YqgV (UPF0045/DUF77 family)